MPMRVLIVPDKFKGTLTAHEAASAIAAGWRKARPNDHLDILPMSDGGDGFGEILSQLTGAKPKKSRTIDAAHRPLNGRWWFDGKNNTAIIDSAAIIGLAMLPEKKFHPFQLDTFGLGRILRAAAEAGASNAILGIGGSATNDGGFGLARALGWRFFDKNWDDLEEWWRLRDLAFLREPDRILPLQITVGVDVGNLLLGPKGCTRIYGPQKGLRQEDFLLAEKCLARMAAVLKQQHGFDGAKISGAGAAGGLGFGLMAFAGARLESGFEIFARHANLDKRIRQSDLVITGEGKLDHQTYMGKGVAHVAQHCRKSGVRSLALAGIVEEHRQVSRIFSQTRSLTEAFGPQRALKKPKQHLQQLAYELAASQANFTP